MEEKCACGPHRSCALCDGIKVSKPPASTPAQVLLGDPEARLSSCLFNPLDDVTLIRLGRCQQCGILFRYVGPLNAALLYLCRCEEHLDNGIWLVEKEFRIQGLTLIPDWLSETEETQITLALDTPPSEGREGWIPSQSGRRKQHFGPTANFKKRKLKLKEGYQGIPVELVRLIHRLDTVAELKDDRIPFQVAEVASLEYLAEQGSNIDPHIDDTWVWGSRIAGICTGCDCVMSFVTCSTTKNEQVVELQLLLPNRCLFIIDGDARYRWLHGIRRGAVLGKRRVSLTIRELTDAILTSHQELAGEIIRLAQTPLPGQ
jgi:alkylated DNA repair protein alkB family protein 4